MKSIFVLLQAAQQSSQSNEYGLIGLLIDVVIIGGIISLIIRFIRKRKNKNAKKSTAHNNSSDQLFKLKELLDQGIITQQEFDEKKKQIMNF